MNVAPGPQGATADLFGLLALSQQAPAAVAWLEGPEHVFRLANDAFLALAGGRDVLQAIEARFELTKPDLRYSAEMLREYGNLSSAFVYFVLQAALADEAPDGWWWLSSFGAGFSCHGALLKVG